MKPQEQQNEMCEYFGIRPIDYGTQDKVLWAIVYSLFKMVLRINNRTGLIGGPSR